MQSNSPKKLFYGGMLVHLMFIVLAIVFYRQRTIFIDIAMHLFELVRTGKPAIQNHRFVALGTQWLPLLGIKAGWSLEALMRAYSVAFPLLYFCVYLVCGALKQYKMALAYLLVQLLMVADTFFWIQSELPQGLAVLVLVFALLEHGLPRRPAPRLGYLIVLPLLIVTLSFAHPLLLFPVLFGAAFFWLRKKEGDRRLLTGAVLLYLVCVAIKTVFFKTPYDSGAMGGIRHFKDLFPDYFRLYSNKRLLINSVTIYLPFTLGLVAMVLHYLRRKARLPLALMAVFLPGYLLLVNVCYPGRETPNFYIENMYLCAGLFLALPLAYDLLPRLWERKFLVTGLGLSLALFAGIRICIQQRPYTERLAWLKSYLAKHKDEKRLSGASPDAREKLTMTWGTPYEFWLLSTTENGRTASLILNDDPASLQWICNESPDRFIVTWGDYRYRELPPRYFRFADSATHYSYRPLED